MRWLPKLITRRERWGLTWLGFSLLAALVLALIALIVRGTLPFLSVTDRKNGQILVIEGWVPDNVAKAAAQLVKSGDYPRVMTSGGPLPYGFYLVDYQDYAHACAATLEKYGVKKDLIKPVAAPVTLKDRTYVSAIALKSWLSTNAPGVRSLDIVTAGSHARRTRLLFEKAFGPDYRIGVIAIEEGNFNPKRWWTTSEGFRTVTGETIAYCYARFLFSP